MLRWFEVNVVDVLNSDFWKSECLARHLAMAGLTRSDWLGGLASLVGSCDCCHQYVLERVYFL